MADAPSPLPDAVPLRSGRHRLTPDEVAGSQHSRILTATIQSVGTRGYHQTTVADIVAGAKVSRTTFYEQFRDKEACFVDAYGFGLTLLEQSVRARVRTSTENWRTRTASEMAAYLDALAAEPALVRCLHVEVLAAGVAAQDQRARLLGAIATRVVALNELARSQEPQLPTVPAEVFALYAGGVDELIRDRLRTGSAGALKDLAAPVLTATFALFGA